tara:strand:- start:143 stop:1183 length:1041 start_codon:yes stop_codon:yes gene_type:complete
MMGKYLMDSELINSGFDADYINLSSSSSLDAIGKGGVGKILAVAKILFKVFLALLRKKYDLCYLTLTAKGVGFYKDALVIGLVKLFGVPRVYHFHNKGVSKNVDAGWKRALYRFVFKDAHCILLSPHLYYDIAAFVPKERVFYCPNGIREEHDTSLTEKQLDAPCNFLFLSNMMEEKGVLVLLEATKILKQRNLDFTCHFVGAWSDVGEKEFFNIVSENQLETMVFAHGKQYGADKARFFKAADVFVFPTYYHNECFPLVLLEAMQYSLPIISTNEGGIADIVIEGKTGLMAKQQDALDLANTMQQLLQDSLSRKRMGSNGKKHFKNKFTHAIFERNMFDILGSLH